MSNWRRFPILLCLVVMSITLHANPSQKTFLAEFGLTPACLSDEPLLVLAVITPFTQANQEPEPLRRAWAYRMIAKALKELRDYPGASFTFEVALAVALNEAVPIGVEHEENRTVDHMKPWDMVMGIIADYSLMLYRQGQYQEAIQLELQAVGLAEAHNARKALAQSYNNLGVLHRKLGEPSLALVYYQKSLTIRRDLGDQRGAAQSLNNLGIIEKNRGNFSEALDYQLQAIEIEKTRGKGRGLARSYGNLGELYNQLSQKEEALIVHHKALGIQTELNDRAGMALSENRIGELLLEQDRLDEAQMYFNRALILNKALDYTSGIATTQANLGNLAIALGQPKAALEHFTRYLVLSERLGNRRMIAKARFELGSLHHDYNRHALALDHLEAGYQESEALEDKPLQLEIARALAGLYGQLGLWQKAYDFQSRSLELTRDLFSREQQLKTAALESRLAMQRQENEIALLTRDNRIQALELNRHRTSRDLLIAGLAIFTGLLILLAMRFRSSMQARQLLIAKNEHIQEKSRELEIANQSLRIKAQETERINEDLYKASVTDALTGAYNRSYLTDFFKRELSKCRRHNLDLSFFMVDIDYFKEVNDTWGHLTGDGVLRDMVDIIGNNIRTEDLIARYGGEEFMIVLPSTNRDQAFTVAEKIRKAVESHTFYSGDESFHISISIGVADVRSSHVQTVDALIRGADDALYQAKNAGRNQAVLFQS